MGECIFCRILAGTAPASFVLREAQCAAFLDVQPVNPGHVLVVPLRHASRLSELAPDDAAGMMRMALRVARALGESGLRCEGVNLQLADGAVAGQTVFHTHLHVIPRFAGDGFGLRFGPGYGRQPGRDVLDDAADRIRGGLTEPGEGPTG